MVRGPPSYDALAKTLQLKCVFCVFLSFKTLCFVNCQVLIVQLTCTWAVVLSHMYSVGSLYECVYIQVGQFQYQDM